MKRLLLMMVFAVFCALGLLVMGPQASNPIQGSAGLPTFNNEVVRIFQQNCQTCHHPGYIAPFSLMTYSEAKPYASVIKNAVQERRMPPWKPSAGCGSFNDERILTTEQIDILSRWADGGAPEGNPADLPAPINFDTGWGLGKPELELKSNEPYVLGPEGDDVYRCFVLPHQFDQDTYVTGVEVQPDAREVVHHVLLFLDGKGESLKLDEKDPGPGYTSFGGPGFTPVGALGGWAPGNMPRFTPKGIGMRVPKGSRVVMQVHYHRNGVEQHDQTRIGLHFAKEPVEHDLRLFPLYNVNFAIPPNAKKHKVVGQYTIPANTDIKVIGISPHMHLLGSKIKVDAILPGKAQQKNNNCMVDIQNWDFKWQGTYTYKEPLSLPGGTKLKLTAFYDNSMSNPNQPNNPPKVVTWGEQTTDEMCLAFVSYILDKKAGRDAGRAMVDEISLDPIANPVIKMNGKDMLESARMRMFSSLLSSSPTEMYNWSNGYTRRDMNLLPWHKNDPSMPGAMQQVKPACH